MSNATVGERFGSLVKRYESLGSYTKPKNSLEYQKTVWGLIKEFKLIQKMTLDLDLFSDNEFIEEINVNYLPFLSIDYYLGQVYMDGMSNESLEIGVDFKSDCLTQSKAYFEGYINHMIELELLNPLQSKQFKGYSLNREEKIQQYKYEKELKGKIERINDVKDEDDKRSIYLDQINLFIIDTLNNLNMINMELEVLTKRPKIIEDSSWKQAQTDARVQDRQFDKGYSTRLETLPQDMTISKLVNNGRVLQPFTLTRSDLKKKVFGTGQVLPSMTVEEYLDYELKNGKMAAPEEPRGEERDTDSEDEEYRKRDWDDWKDDNPKGMGNTMNLG